MSGNVLRIIFTFVDSLQIHGSHARTEYSGGEYIAVVGGFTVIIFVPGHPTLRLVIESEALRDWQISSLWQALHFAVLNTNEGTALTILVHPDAAAQIGSNVAEINEEIQDLVRLIIQERREGMTAEQLRTAIIGTARLTDGKLLALLINRP
jgi:hypothetical protein